MRETVDNKVYFEQADYDKLVSEVPKVLLKLFCLIV